MTEQTLVKIYYALVDDEGTAHSIHNRREAIEHELEERRAMATPSQEERQYSLCEMVPWTNYEQIPLELRDQYPPVTPITDAEPKLIADGPNGPLECVPTIHARRMEHILDQYLHIHDLWQKAMERFIVPTSWCIEPDEVEKFIADLIASQQQDRERIEELERRIETLTTSGPMIQSDV